MTNNDVNQSLRGLSIYDEYKKKDLKTGDLKTSDLTIGLLIK